MKKILLLLVAILVGATALAATKPTPSTATDAVWYYIQFLKENAVIEAPATAGEVKTALGTGKDAQLWRLEGNDADGYTLFSKSGFQLYVTNATKNSGFFNASASPSDNVSSDNVRFDIVASTVSNFTDGYLLAPHGASVYANQWQGQGAGKRLGLWDADAGCVLRFVPEADFDLTYQPAPADVPEVALTAATTVPAEPLTLWYKAPATIWTSEALPIGNGDMGAMIFGGVAQDRIQFNHKTFWRGGTGDNALGTYMNFGELYIINRDASAVTDYQRRLDIHRAVAEVDYRDAQSSYHREYLASNPDGVIAVRYTASEGTPLNLELQFINSYGERAVYTADGAVFKGVVNNGLKYRAEMRVVVPRGTVTYNKNCVSVADASEMTVYITCGTDYSTTHANHMTGDAAAVEADQRSVLDAAVSKGFAEISARHTEDYQRLFDRVDFQLADAANSVETKQLLQATGLDATQMVDMLVFQYGRYLTIASSRGVDLPSNLQGIWCKDGNASQSATWASDIHTNINVQMNYWPAESTNLSECHAPLLNFLYNESQRTDGGWQQHARKLGVNRGWVVNTASNIFGGSSNYKVGSYSCANAWLCSHLWQHYAYTRDAKFLKEKAFPVMKSACEFWFDRLIDVDGVYECPHEYSPEQGHVQNATAHSQQLVTQLFLDMQSALDALGDEADCDDDFRATLAERLSKIDRGLRIDDNGLLREWKYQENTPNLDADKDYFANDEQNVWKGHRHTSHLMGLYPHFEIDPGKDASIFKAAVASLEDRGDVATGWARAWRISLWARSRDAQHTYTTLRGFAHRTTALSYDWHGGLYDNLMDAHATSVFQIEGNFGATAGIAEMLLQSRPDSLVLMPALPTQWAEGHMHGLRAIGNFGIDLDWQKHRLAKMTISSGSGLPLVLAYPGIEKAVVTLADGTPVRTDATKAGRLSFDTTEGASYVLTLEYDPSYEPEVIEPDTDIIPLNVDKDQVYTNKYGRKLNSVTIKTDTHGTATLSCDATKVYNNLTDNRIGVKPGDEITVTAGYTGNWMNSYIYIDRNNDKQLTYELGENGVPTADSELMSYSYYSGDDDNDGSGFNSLGNPLTTQGRNVLNAPKFVMPDIAPGLYTLRFKVDWNSVDPGGDRNTKNDDFMANGGAIVDVKLHVYSPADVNCDNRVSISDAAQYIDVLAHPDSQPQSGYSIEGLQGVVNGILIKE